MDITARFPATHQTQAERSEAMPFSPTAYVALIQGLYFFVTGVWPLVSIDTFQMVTGPKTDLWLAQTVGVLVAVIGAVLLAAFGRRRATAEIVLLGLASAIALIGVDVVFVVRNVIDRIYLLDAAAEAALVVMWLAALTIEALTAWKRSRTCL